MRREKISNCKKKTSGNLEKSFHHRKSVKTQVKAPKHDDESGILLYGKLKNVFPVTVTARN